MRHLWAPWRSIYLSRMRKPTKRSLRDPEAKPLEVLHSGKQIDKKRCFICQALKKKNDRGNLVLVRTKNLVVIMNRYPYNTGHLLIAPRRHKGNLEDLTSSEIQGLFDLLKKMKRLLSGVLKPQGFNIGINLGRVAGAGLQNHIHLHLVPRWSGDTNFMPIINDTKVLSQSLQDLYQQLKSRMKRPK